MLVFPNCKINLGLSVIRKRQDGYHDLETIFYPLPVTDILEITEFKNAERSATIPLIQTGLAIDTEAAQNLCTKAYKLLKNDW